MQLDILDNKGKSLEKVTLEKSVFEAEPNKEILAQYVRVFRTNQRQGTAKAKTRAEVSGGGRKPWRQKGTGRARQGSIRSPLWPGGGKAHGPKPRPWNLSLPKRMKKVAVVSALSLIANKKGLKAIDKFEFKKPETKTLKETLKNIKAGGKVLIVTSGKKENVMKSAGNLEKVNVAMAENLNTYEILNASTVVFEKDALELVTKKYKK